MVLVNDAADPGTEEISQDQLYRLRAVVALFPFPGHPFSSFSFVSRVLQLAAMVSMIAFHASFRIRSGAEYLNASVVHIGLGAYHTRMVFS
jgi:hypothetical protein